VATSLARAIVLSASHLVLRRFYVAGVPERVIAEIMAWEEEHVARIIRRYVDRTAATRAIPLATQQKENVACKTGSKTVSAKAG